MIGVNARSAGGSLKTEIRIGKSLIVVTVGSDYTGLSNAESEVEDADSN